MDEHVLTDDAHRFQSVMSVDLAFQTVKYRARSGRARFITKIRHLSKSD